MYLCFPEGPDSTSLSQATLHLNFITIQSASEYLPQGQDPVSGGLGTQDSRHWVPSCLPLKQSFLWFDSLAFSPAVDSTSPYMP